jgi:hypothetical protein
MRILILARKIYVRNPMKKARKATFEEKFSITPIRKFQK